MKPRRRPFRRNPKASTVIHSLSCDHIRPGVNTFIEHHPVDDGPVEVPNPVYEREFCVHCYLKKWYHALKP